MIKRNYPTKQEILNEMELYNNDEVGLNNKWTFEETEYYLLLSDKYYKKGGLKWTQNKQTKLLKF
jgi:hypothetical protein